ncbi:hypothetical protein GCM10010218_07560 [Streptomyces mashuensis]|uniref:Histidine kinase/HSP90-like ATPase domain-containing protein n=1 Tax=Streptomyces mashuensis TaxID=33904 RepID=A0A919AWE2_9ACTN|nr:ATP-binding protein [Streptomyces mashuensis]GHF28894.1 hypothetical protein GCM10010218_07560 [Streptomyces mashuensis]
MPPFSRDTAPLAAWPAPPRRLDGFRGAGFPSCSHSPVAPWTLRGLPPGPPPARSLTLPPVTTSVAVARRFTHRLLTEWGLPELADDATLLLSELVTNAIVHVPGDAGDVRVAVSRTPGHLVVQVSDRGGRLPRCAEAGADSEGGRGMWLVEQLAAAWGHHAAAGGKTVWFALPLPPGA